jgi:serine/threonine-protein kinase
MHLHTLQKRISTVRGPLLDRYEIVGELGQGGMSVVYRARDRQLSREVALKVLHEFLARQPDARKRFHREAVAVAKLHHPGILEIFDYSGPDAEDTYIVTELIEGETLRDFVDKRGRLPYPELGVLIVLELVRALRHAHEQSVIHRDLKPENVMITKEGVLKLMDFGLAQMMDGGTKLTATGTLLGSPAHMAPEVIDGKVSDARADIFSMGTILYWLTTGKLPFEAPNPSALFKKILDGKYEDPQLLEPRVGNNLARITKKALESDPDQRYQDVTELCADLARELEVVDIGPPDIEAKHLLKDPEAYAKEIGPKLVATLALRGKESLKEGNVARAMDRFNRVLAIDPHHEEVRRLVARVGRRRALLRRAKQTVSVMATGACLGAIAYGAVLYVPKLMEAVSQADVEAKKAELPASLQPPAKIEPIASTAAAIEAPPVDVQPKIEAPPRTKVVHKERQRKEMKQAQGADTKAEAPAVEAPARIEEPATAKSPLALEIVVTHGAASHIKVDGEQIVTNGYGAKVENLRPGPHQVELRWTNGNISRRTVVATEQGFSLRDEKGEHRLPARELRIDLNQP